MTELELRVITRLEGYDSTVTRVDIPVTSPPPSQACRKNDEKLNEKQVLSNHLILRAREDAINVRWVSGCGSYCERAGCRRSRDKEKLTGHVTRRDIERIYKLLEPMTLGNCGG